MSRHVIRFSLHTFRIVLILCVGLLMFIGFLFWQLSQKPIDLGFAKEAIEAALYDAETGNSVKLDKVVLYWPDYTGPLLLALDKTKLYNKEGAEILSIDKAEMSFSRSSLLLGKLRPKNIILKKPQLHVVRGADGSMDIGFGFSNQAPSQGDDGMMKRVLGYLARPGHEAVKNSIISRLEAFEIKDAQVLVDDKKYSTTWKLPHFTAGFFSTQKGLSADFNALMDSIEGKNSVAKIQMDYFWDSKKSKITADFENIDTKMLLGNRHDLKILSRQNLVFNSHIDAVLDENFLPMALGFDLKSPMGDIYHPDFSEDLVPYTDLSVTAIYDTASQTLIVDNTNITLAGGATIRLKGDIKQENGKIYGPLKAEIYDIAQAQIGPLWPVAFKGDNAEQWIVHKMSGGHFQNVWVGFDLEASVSDKSEVAWNIETNNIQAGFGFKDMNVDYRSPLFPVSKANGSGVFDLNKDEMKINISSAMIGNMNVAKADLLFDRLIEQGVGDVDIKMDLNGPLQEAMNYLAQEPIYMNKNMKMDLSKVKGKAEAQINIKFPAVKDVKMEQFAISGKGILKDYKLPAVVKQLDLSGKNIDFEVKEGAFSLTGKAELGQRDIDLAYVEHLKSEGRDFKSKVKASLVADPNIRTQLGMDLSSFLEGSVPVRVEYTTKADGSAVAIVDADLKPAVFFVDPFDFEKASGVEGKASFTAHFKNKELVNITDLSASGKNFDIGKSKISFIQKDKETFLSEGKIGQFSLGDTKGGLEFEIDKDRVAKIVFDASFLDARPFLDAEPAKAKYSQLPMMISVTASSMRTADLEVVKAAKIFMDVDAKGRFNQMEMDAIAGASAVYLRYSPDETGKRTFRLKTDDAGAALRSFQVYSNIRGGKMVIYGEPVEGALDRNLIGKAQITDFKAVKAPILTKLLSLISVPGLIEVMSSDGLNFSKLEADFNWVYHKEGSVLVLKEGRTSGNSLGLTFDGTFDNAKRLIDVKGTIVPMSEVNNLIGGIPLVGDILTGGTGGIFAATYSIKGSSEGPDIGINPLSVLTPGIIRRILFEQ